MGYIKASKTESTIKRICTLLFQLCVISDAIIGLDPKLYVISKGLMLAFFVVMVINILWNKEIYIGSAIISPILFMIITALSCLWAAYPEASITRLVTQVQLYVLFLFTYLMFSNEKIDLKKYLDALYISGICMALFALYRYGVTGIIKGLNDGQRLGRAITNENVFGMVFSKAALVAYYYFICAKVKKIKLAHVFLVIIFTFFAFSSGSKKAFLMVLFGILCINALENGINKLWKSLAISIVAILALLLVLQIPVFSIMKNRIIQFFSGEKDNGDMIRSKMIDLSMELFKEKPLLGHGLSNFGVLTGLGTYSHNNMTEILVSTGIVGFIVFYIPYLQMIIQGWKYGVKRKNYVATSILILSLIYLIFGYGMVEYYDKEYWTFLGVMIACVDNFAENQSGRDMKNARLQTLYF